MSLRFALSGLGKVRRREGIGEVALPTMLGPRAVLDARLMSSIGCWPSNVTGSYLMLRAAAARMTPQQVGRIVNISSITAFDGGGTYSKGVCAIAKAVVVGMCRGGAGELGSYGITVNVIAPVQVSAVKAALTAPRAHGGAVRGRPDAALPGRAACRSRRRVSGRADDVSALQPTRAAPPARRAKRTADDVLAVEPRPPRTHPTADGQQRQQRWLR